MAVATLPGRLESLDDRKPSTKAWRRHSLASALVRAAIVGLPILMAVIAGLLVGSSFGGQGIGSDIERAAVAFVASVVAFGVIERVARRLLPLTALLKLSLVFPDQAPSRFSVALRSSSVKRLQEWAHESHEQDSNAALAEKVVTLAAALNNHDRRTRGHSERSRAIAELIARQIGLSEEEVNEVR